MHDGYIPSYCTACYREGRTGDRFMRLAKTGQIANVCQANAHAHAAGVPGGLRQTRNFRALGNAVIARELDAIPNAKIRAKTPGLPGENPRRSGDLRF